MSRMTLQTRLLLSFGLVVALALGGGYLLVDRSVDRAFQSFLVRDIHERDLTFARLIASYYARTGSWEGISEALSQNARHFPFVLADADGQVRHSGKASLDAEQLPAERLESGVPLRVDGERVGTLVPILPQPPTGPVQKTFLSSVNRALWMTGLVSGGVAILLAVLLIRQMTGPVRRLDTAAKRISEGNLSERVDPRGSDELARLGRSFNEMAESLQQTEQDRRNMIADIAHELRTPISVVRSGLEGMMDDVLKPNPENIAALHGKTLLVSRLVADLQELALADAGRLSIEPETLSLAEVVGHVVATVEGQFDDQGIALETDVPADLPRVYVDRHRLEQVFLNLLSNALQHTPENGTVSVKADRRDASSVQVSVCDSGSGLSSEDAEQVFDRFYRADKSRSRHSGGSGLGLPIAKAIVEAHGGTIWAENDPTGGACFRFTMRIATDASDDPDTSG